MVRCAIKYCQNTGGNCFKRVGSISKINDKKNKISFHKFPKDVERCKQWIELCCQTNIDAAHGKSFKKSTILNIICE